MEVTKVQLEDTTSVTCSCGAVVTMGRVVGTNHFGIVHPIPMCGDFQTREPKEYLRWLVTLTQSQGNA